MANLKVGDTVRLKSGGPLMTIAEIDSDGEIYCVLFDKGKKLDDTFPAEALMLDNS